MAVRTCFACGVEQPQAEFYKNTSARLNGGSVCRSCKRRRDAAYRDRNRVTIRADRRAWHAANRERSLAHSKKYARKIREAVLAAYGGKCACCGEVAYEFLTIDHINGGGRKHRSEVGFNICRVLHREGFPPGYRVLCWNCNCALGRYGRCPHAAL